MWLGELTLVSPVCCWRKVGSMLSEVLSNSIWHLLGTLTVSGRKGFWVPAEDNRTHSLLVNRGIDKASSKRNKDSTEAQPWPGHVRCILRNIALLPWGLRESIDGSEGVTPKINSDFLLSYRPFIWCLYVWRCLYKKCDESTGISYP